MNNARELIQAVACLQYTENLPNRKVKRPVSKCKSPMKFNRTPVFWGISAALLLGSTYSDALTLGRVRGAALLGRPLDLSVPVQFAEDEDVSSACFKADVFYGDTPLESSRITVSAQPGAQANSQVVRVTSTADIDEALVRLTLRAICNPKASRSYTLLSDVASELAGAATPARIAPRTEALERPSGTSTAAVAPATASPGNSGAATPVAKPAASLPRQHALAKVRSTLKPAAQAGSAGAATSAKLGAAMNSAAMEELLRRVDEIAKRQASGISAEDLLKSETRAKALEADIRALQLLTAKNQQSIQMVAAALENNESQNYGRPLLFGLGALLLGCIGALVYMARRMRSGGLATAPWWSADNQRPESEAAVRATSPASLVAANSIPASLATSPSQLQEAYPESGSAAFAARSGDTAAGTVSMELPATNFAATANPQPALSERSARPDFAPSVPGQMRSINTKEMLDVRQQAEFFMALGQHDEAVRLLESNIRGSADCNPLVFLDLLKIFHTLGRRGDFEQYREEFNAQFTGRIPPYASFLSEGNGLDAYVDICQQIVVLWPTEYTIDYIEQCLVRLPEDDPEQGIDLEAFKDLLLLYGVLKRLDQGYDSNLAPFSTSRSDQTLTTAPSAGMTSPMPVTPEAYSAPSEPVDLDLDLDLNLDEVGEPAALPDQNNLIDFDMSDYMAQKKSDAAK